MRCVWQQTHRIAFSNSPGPGKEAAEPGKARKEGDRARQGAPFPGAEQEMPFAQNRRQPFAEDARQIQAFVVQRIERRFPKPQIRVRFPARVQEATEFSAASFFCMPGRQPADNPNGNSDGNPTACAEGCANLKAGDPALRIETTKVTETVTNAATRTNKSLKNPGGYRIGTRTFSGKKVLRASLMICVHPSNTKIGKLSQLTTGRTFL